MYCEELKRRLKRRNKTKIPKELQESVKFLSKKRKIEFFSHSELKDLNLDKLKLHLHLNFAKRYIKAQESELVIDLSLSSSQSDEIESDGILDKEKFNVTEGNNKFSKLIMPKME